MTPEPVTTGEGARLVRRSVDTVNNWVRRGWLVPVGERPRRGRGPAKLYRVADVVRCDRLAGRRRARGVA